MTNNNSNRSDQQYNAQIESIFLQGLTASKAQRFLAGLQTIGKIQAIDFHFASFIEAEIAADAIDEAELNLLVLLSGFVSANLHGQHSCLKLTDFDLEAVIQQGQLEISKQQSEMLGTKPLLETIVLPSKERRNEVVRQSKLVTEITNLQQFTQPISPLVLYEGYLYLNRYFNFERSIAGFISNRTQSTSPYKQQDVEPIVARFFNDKGSNHGDINWQQQAVINAIHSNFSVITGGPGTGKTTTVVKLLACLLLLEQEYKSWPAKPQIQLVAPTGKAAQRLSESISNSKRQLPVSEDILALLPSTALTIHRLLKPRDINKFLYDKNNVLDLQIIVIDEASMIDLSLMNSLFQAIPTTAKVVLLGDKHQLSSVEAGNVLAEISSSSAAFVSELKKSYRFDGHGEIGRLAGFVKAGNTEQARNVLQQSKQNLNSELTWLQPDQEKYHLIIEQCVAHQQRIIELSAQLTLENERELVASCFEHLAKFQILTCVKEGEFGVEGINHQVKARLAQRFKLPTQQKHFHTRPIMIQENAYHLDLYNGDIGLQLVDPISNELVTYFYRSDQSVLKVFNQRLPSHQTVYAMTVHKSQGSEFTHTLLVLPEPNKQHRILSRELIYTGLTRAKKHFTLFAGMSDFEAAIQRRTARYSGLSTMLMK